MKVFRKLALVSAIATLPAAGFAMQAMDDAALSGVTGQDGISITLGLNQTMNVLIDDTTGLTNATPVGLATFDQTGGILIRGMALAGTVGLEIDAAGDSTNGVLVVDVNVSGLSLDTGDIYVIDTGKAASATHQAADSGTAALAGVAPSQTAILDSMNISIASLELQVQLGDGAENFVNITNGLIGDVTITNFSLNDAAGGGSIAASSILIEDLDITDTTVSLEDGTTNPAGLRIALDGSIAGVTVDSLVLGSGNALGNVYINGLSLSGTTITVAGK